MKKTIGLLIVLFLVATAIVLSFGKAYGVGSCELTVDLAPEVCADITQIYYVGATHAEIADWVVNDLETARPEMEHQAFATPFKVYNYFTISSYTLADYEWYVYSDRQAYHELIVVLQRADGSESVYRIKIPDRKVSRRVLITPNHAV